MLRFFSQVMLFIGISMATPAVAKPDPVLKVGEKSFSLGDMAKMTKAVALEVYEPHEQRNVTYRGFAMDSLFDKLLGMDWRKGDDILFTCADGYEASVPLSYFQKHKGYLVYERVGTDFRLTNTLQGNEVVDLRPFYVVWENLKDEEVKKDNGTHWPYQVTSIKVVDFAKAFPKTFPDNPSAAVERGFAIYRRHCMTCHSINGDGGDKSVELNFPVSVTEYIKPEWLTKWIDDPQAIRFNSRMPRLNVNLENREQAIRDIISYLQAMAKKKIEP